MGNLLESLGFRKKYHVGISISANNFVELAYIDKPTKTLSRYASGEIKYNAAIREIMDFDEVETVISALFEETDLDPQKCCVTLNVPNVYFGISQTDSNADQSSIIENIQADVEDLYIFKRNEPVISYAQLPSMFSQSQKNIVYSAIQSKTIMKIIETFEKLGIELERIDNSYASLLKALKFCDKFNKYLAPEEKTIVLVITQNNFCSMALNGGTIVSSKETPLAIKSFSSEEVYSMVANNAHEAIDSFSSNNMIIISETEDINSELLSEKINFSGERAFVNKSTGSDDEIIDIDTTNIDVEASMISFVTLEAVGAAASTYDEYPLNLNFLPDDRINKKIVEIGGYEIEFTRYVIEVLIFTLLLAALCGFLLSRYFETQKDNSSQKNQMTSEKIKEYENRALRRQSSGQAVNIFPEMKKIIENNKYVTDTYIALSTELPDTVYIKRYVTQPNGAIGILGESQTSEAVESFINRLKEKNTELAISKLAVNSKNDVNVRMPNGFTFEIKTNNVNVDLSDDAPNIQAMYQQSLQSPVAGRRVRVNVGSDGIQDVTPPPPPVI